MATLDDGSNMLKFCLQAVTTIETRLERTTISPNAYYNITHKLYFEVEQDGKELGNIIFGLYAGAVPKTVSNFRQIALMGITEDLSYMGSRFYKIVPGVKIQGILFLFNISTK